MQSEGLFLSHVLKAQVVTVVVVMGGWVQWDFMNL